MSLSLAEAKVDNIQSCADTVLLPYRLAHLDRAQIDYRRTQGGPECNEEVVGIGNFWCV